MLNEFLRLHKLIYLIKMLFFATCVSLDNLCKKLKTILFLIIFNYYFSEVTTT